MRRVTMVVEFEVDVHDDKVDTDDLCLELDMNLIGVISASGPDDEDGSRGNVREFGTKQVILHG